MHLNHFISTVESPHSGCEGNRTVGGCREYSRERGEGGGVERSVFGVYMDRKSGTKRKKKRQRNPETTDQWTQVLISGVI